MALNTITLTPKQESGIKHHNPNPITRKWAVMYLFVMCIDFDSFNNFPIRYWNCSVWYLLLLILIFPLFLLRSVWRYQRGNCHYQQFFSLFSWLPDLMGPIYMNHDLYFINVILYASTYTGVQYHMVFVSANNKTTGAT